MAGTLRPRILEDLRRALKAQDKGRLSILRLLEDALKNEELAKKVGELTDEEARRILEREAKRRREAAAAFEQGGRGDRAAAERAEGDVIEGYLPRQLSDAELEDIVRPVIAEQGREASAGTVMGKVMTLLRGRADGARVRDLVSRILSQR